MLQLTGFVLPDVGILTITAMANKSDPSQVTREDLDEIAEELQTFYSQGVGKSLAAGVVFPNSGFVQSEFDKPQFQHKRQAWADFVLRGHQQLDLEPILQALDKKEYRAMVLRGVENASRCAFTGQPAYLRVSRDMLPMLNGRGIPNFGPMGAAGLPVSDVMLLAIHALPLGCIVTQGALLAVESDDADLMAAFVRANLAENRRFINLARQEGYEKYPNLSAYKSRLITVLAEALSKQQQQWGDAYRMPSLMAYHFSNNGTSARVTLYALPSSTVQFVYNVSEGQHKAAWKRIVASGWTEDKAESEELKSKTPKLTRRNFIYEDLFDLPENARDFLRTYFLRRPLKAFKRDPRATYNLFKEADFVSWDLTALFLKDIINMETSRIGHIRTLGDRLATHIRETNDRRLLKALYYENKYWLFRKALLRAMYGYTGDEPLVTFEGYVQIFESFEEGHGIERADWNLARDLLLIRVFEQLHAQGYWSAVTETLQGEDEDAVLKPVTD
ncbi:MAG: type I-B CRISPR-associated protein Cas8b1/Cst1 [bacterium]|nr:type I-B CRISPR-associated protein Cas8b1/Cst1 [bacterium]